MQQKMRKTLVVLALLGAALFNYPRPGRGGTASGAYSQAAMNAYGGRATAYPEYEETSREAPGKDYPKACLALGLSEDCTETMTKSQVRRAYTTWHRENHPDKTGRYRDRTQYTVSIGSFRFGLGHRRSVQAGRTLVGRRPQPRSVPRAHRDVEARVER